MEELIKELIPYGITSATAITALIKNPDVIKLIYKDIAHPSVKKVGDALSSVFGLSATLLLPLKLLNEKTNIVFTNHMEQYRKKIETIPEDKIAEVPPEIGVPILDRLTYTNDLKLSELYVNLLANASHQDEAINVHPYFISAISNLCPDEAVLLKNIYDYYVSQKMTHIPYISIVEIETIEKYHSSTVLHVDYLVKKELISNIQYNENYRLYIDNLISLGFLEKNSMNMLTDKEKYYKPIYDEYEEEFQLFKKNTHLKEGNRIEGREGYILITETGTHFLNAINNKVI